MATELPYWLYNTRFTGREEAAGGGTEGVDNDNEGDGDEEGEGEGAGSVDIDTDDTSALKKALEEERKGRREERKLRRKAEREARAALEGREAGEEQKNLEETQQKLQSAEQKTQRLAARLLSKERDDAIVAEARRLGFIDPTDALTDDIRRAVDVDQDPEDPSDIEVDQDSVKAAVKALAARKKHLVGAPGGGAPSGNKFRKNGNPPAPKTEEALMKDIYPSLR